MSKDDNTPRLRFVVRQSRNGKNWRVLDTFQRANKYGLARPLVVCWCRFEAQADGIAGLLNEKHNARNTPKSKK